MARTYPADSGALPAAHTDVSGQLSDVSGPPSGPSRPDGSPMAGPTVRSSQRIPHLKNPAQPGPTGL